MRALLNRLGRTILAGIRAVLTVIAGDPVRVSTSSLALVVIGAVLTGKGQVLLAAVWALAVTSCAFSIAFMALAIAAAVAGAVDEPAAAPSGKGNADA